jgi:hypothetical protein
MVQLALTSDLFDVLLPFLCGIKSDFLDFLGEVLPPQETKPPNWQNLQKNSLRGRDP